MPFWDRKIEMVILSHPEKDHFGGLIEVFKRYEVERLLMFPVESGTLEYQALKKVVGGNGSEAVYPRNGRYARSGLLYLDILYPSDETLGYYLSDEGDKVLGVLDSSLNLNDLSIVAIIGLGDFQALLTGDIGPKVAKEIVESGANRKVNYIKIPHHGSKNGLTEEFLKAFEPEVAVISVGKNPWGHPHQEVLKILNDKDIKN